jgi:RNA polymerase sigma-70 factor (ECF subfamily)
MLETGSRGEAHSQFHVNHDTEDQGKKIDLTEELKKLSDPKFLEKIKGYVLMLRTGLEKAELDDLNQVILEKVLKNQSSYEGRSTLEGWIFKIAEHTTIDFLRKTEVRRKRVIDLPGNVDETTDEEDGELSVIDELDKRRFGELINKVVETFPEDQRKVFDLHREGKSHSEIAKSLNLPAGTVKSMISSAQEKIKKQVEDDLKKLKKNKR